MQSQTTSRFRRCFNFLPQSIQDKTKKAFRLWLQDPNHPSLHFKKIHSIDPVYSVRIDLNYRALGVREGNVLVWFWVGTHEEYNKLLSER